MVNSIKNWLLHQKFESKARPNEPTSTGINTLQSIGILFDGTDEEERKVVHKFKKNINPDQKRDIKSLAFINNKLPLDNIDYSAYNLKDVKWFGLPFGEKIDEFIQYNFDLLIVISKQMLPHTEYIVAHSKSKFIIGTGLELAEKYFDIIVDVENSDSTNVILNKITTAINKIAIK